MDTAARWLDWAPDHARPAAPSGFRLSLYSAYPIPVVEFVIDSLSPELRAERSSHLGRRQRTCTHYTPRWNRRHPSRGRHWSGGLGGAVGRPGLRRLRLDLFLGVETAPDPSEDWNETATPRPPMRTVGVAVRGPRRQATLPGPRARRRRGPSTTGELHALANHLAPSPGGPWCGPVAVWGLCADRAGGGRWWCCGILKAAGGLLSSSQRAHPPRVWATSGRDRRPGGGPQQGSPDASRTWASGLCLATPMPPTAGPSSDPSLRPGRRGPRLCHLHLGGLDGLPKGVPWTHGALPTTPPPGPDAWPDE